MIQPRKCVPVARGPLVCGCSILIGKSDRLCAEQGVATTIGVIRETTAGETRVALLPEHLKKPLSPRKDGPAAFACVVEAGAGARAYADDAAYAAAGAEILGDAAEVASRADVLLCVQPPDVKVIASMRSGTAIVGLLRPGESDALLRACAGRGVSALAFEKLPRITRAQKSDVLSSMSTVAGYRAALDAAALCPRFFPMMMTAAGTITPARVLVVGAGVAGLQAIATARRLGAIVEGYDIRPAAKEQVLSLGARFVELPAVAGDAETGAGYAREQTAEEQAAQRELLARHVVDSDVVITTALVPGRPAPRLIDRATVERMKPGSMIVDLAAEAGGNCELTRAGEIVEVGGVRISGPANLPASMPVHASKMYGQNTLALLEELAPGGEMRVDLENDMIGPMCVVNGGEVMLGQAGAVS